MVTKSLLIGGAEKMFMWLATSLANMGHEVIVYTYQPCRICSLPENILWIKTDLESSGFYSRYRVYRKMIKEHQPKCSISFLLEANVLNILSCMNTPTKSVVCERCDPYKPFYYKLRIMKPLFRLADGGVFQLEKVKQYYSVIRRPTAVIPNPVFGDVNSVPVRPFCERDDYIITLGRLDIFQKRQDILIRAFGKFHKRYPHIKLFIYGDGEDKAKIERIVKTSGLQYSVILAGVTDKPEDIIRNAKFFVLSSAFEGIPNALIEAMSTGIPCISTDCSPGGASLLIVDGVNGSLVPVNDAEALYSGMCRFMEDGDWADRMGQEGRKIVGRFPEKQIINQWNDYLNCLADN